MTEPIDTSFQSLLHELRVIPPPEEFAAKAHIRSLEEYETLYRRSVENPEEFWAAAASELHWFEPWTQALEWNEPWAKWFVGGKMNLAYNCLDLQVERGRGGKTAILWESESGEVRKYTFLQLLDQVKRFANVLKLHGVKKGDCVALYMGMVPELAIAILACARIGAVHSVIFGGFAASALVDRINDAQSVLVITQDAVASRSR
jgi:acetyl-CoA synthetase